MSIDIRAEMPAETFLVEQTVPVRVTIENRTDSPVSVPDPLLNDLTPEYIITGPDNKQTTVTHALTHLKVASVHDPEAPPVTERMDLPPKGSWSELIPLDPMVTLSRPGTYHLQVAYTVNGQRVVTSQMRFQIIPANVSAFAVMPQGPYSREARLSTAWAHAGGDQIAVVEAVRLGRLWGRDAGGKLYSTVAYRGSGSELRQIGVPAMYSDRGMDFTNWVVWVQGGKVRAQRTEAGEARGTPELAYSSADTGLWLIDSLAMDAQHNLRIFLVEVTAGKASLLRVDVARGSPSSVRVAYRVPLPSLPVAAQAIHFRENSRDQSLIFCLTTGNESSLLAIPDGPSPAVISLNRFNRQLLPGHALSVYRGDDGLTYASVAVNSGSGTSISVATVAAKGTGERVGDVATRDISLGENSSLLAWGFLADTRDGPQLLWRNQQGRLLYCSATVLPVFLVPAFRAAPPPALLIGDSSAFVAGVRETGAFGIERISRDNVRLTSQH
jgi:hypothetical protein